MENNFITSGLSCKRLESRIFRINIPNSLNLLTKNRSAHYSGGMNSEFQLLSAKVDQLAKLTLALRHENAELRRGVAALTAENAELSRRMQDAHRRVSALLEKIPGEEQDQEAA